MQLTDWIMAIATFVYVVATILILLANNKSAKIANEQFALSKANLEPLLSMKLTTIKGFLYIIVENHGMTAAKDINLTVKSIKGNGSYDKVPDSFAPFELFPTEKIEHFINVFGENMSTGILIPVISLDISYTILGTEKTVSYSRTVAYAIPEEEKATAQTGTNNNVIEKNLNLLTTDLRRIANYLDGCQLTIIDNINIISSKSLSKDLSKIAIAIENTSKLAEHSVDNIEVLQNDEISENEPSQIENTEAIPND
jgi:hypothetical protein